MKNHDVTKPVMEKIVSYERMRVRTLFLRLIVVFGALLFVLGSALYLFAQELVERQTLELVELIFEDPEVISEFWRDALYVIWEELPRRWLIMAGIIVATGLYIWIATKQKRNRARAIQSNLEHYHKNRYSRKTRRRI